MSIVGAVRWKLPMLKPGEYDWWVKQMKTYLCSVDSQLWKIILKGNDIIRTEEEEDYTDDDFKALERNSRALITLQSALPPEELKKFLPYGTAQEVWNALKRMYGGNDDVKKNRILAAAQDYDNAKQGVEESLTDFHTRFQTHLAQMRFLGEEILEWKVTHKFLQSLNSSWDAVVLAIQSQSDSKSITLEELIAKLQSQANLVERRLAQRNLQKYESTALKAEKSEGQTEGDKVSEGGNSEIALLTKAIANLARRRNFNRNPSGGQNSSGENKGDQSGGNEGNTEKRKDVVCYHCGKKGHFSRNCYSKERGDPPAPKPREAMFAIWEDSDQEDNDRKTIVETCLMAHSTPSEVTDFESCDDEILSRTNLADSVAQVLTINQELSDKVVELEDELNAAMDETVLWSAKAIRLENELADHVCKCTTCDEREVQIRSLDDELRKLKIESFEIADFKDQIDEMDKELINLRKNKENLLGSLENLRHEMEREKEKGNSNQEKEKTEGSRKVIFVKGSAYEEQRPKQKTKAMIGPFNGNSLDDEDSVANKAKIAYNIWKKMSQNQRTSMSSTHTMAKMEPTVHATMIKKVNPSDGTKDQSCWYCRRVGHFRSKCPERRHVNKNYGDWRRVPYHYPETSQQMVYRSSNRETNLGPNHEPVTWGRPRRAPKRKIDLSNQNVSCVVNAARFIPKPSKPKLVWVRKN